MLRALPLLLLALPASAHLDRLGEYPRLDRRDRLESPSGPLLSMALTASGAAECDGAVPDGLTFTRASDAFCTRSDGTLRRSVSHWPRVSARGLRVEGPATNLVLHSRDLSQAAWTATNVTTSYGAAGPASDGNAPATRLTGGVGGGTVSQALTVAAATRSTSFYARTPTSCDEMLAGRAGVGGGGDVVPITSTWRRYAPSCLSGDSYCYAIPSLSDGSANPDIAFTLSDGCVADITLVQDEAGSYATSPIATAGTAATRAGDGATTPRPGAFSDAAGCIAATATFPPSVAVNQRITAFANSNNTPFAVNASTSLQAWDGANSTLLLGLPALGGRSVRALTTWAGSTLTLSSLTDGASNSGTYDGTWAPGVIGIGARSDGTEHLNGYLSNLVIDNTATGCSP